MWRMTPIIKMQMALQHVETFLVTFLECFLAWRWEQNIIRYLTIDESTPKSNQLLETQNTSSSSIAMISLSTSAKSIASELSTLRAEHVSHRSGGVGASHHTVILQQRRWSVNRQENALERIITKIGQNVINRIRVNWTSMETDWVSAKWQQPKGIIMNLI